MALHSFNLERLKRSPRLPLQRARGRSEKMKTSAPLQIPRNFSLRTGPGPLKTPGSPHTHIPLPTKLSEEVDPLAWKNGLLESLCVLFTLLLFSAYKRLPLTNTSLKSSQDFLCFFFFGHISNMFSCKQWIYFRFGLEGNEMIEFVDFLLPPNPETVSLPYCKNIYI